MANKYRDELVGKRFLSIRSEGKPKIKQISDWDWRGGYVRAVTQRDLDSNDVMVSFCSFIECELFQMCYHSNLYEYGLRLTLFWCV